jgi:transcriptional regulator with XRE-family HTH domain
MATRRNRIGDAAWQSRLIRGEAGREVREARLDTGLSLAAAGKAVGMSHSQFGRIERAVLPNLTIEQLCRACTAVGLKLVVRAYPDGDPVRDAAQLGLIERFRRRVPAGISFRTEVPLPIPGDRRAWDGMLTFPGTLVAVEAESRLRDVQALERRLALKCRDGSVDRLILLVNDTKANRRVLRLHLEGLRGRFPLSGRDVLAAVTNGRAPSANGLVLM